MSDRVALLQDRLKRHGQAHVLTFLDELTPDQQAALLDQVEQLSFASLDPLIEQYVRNRPGTSLPTTLEPAPYYTPRAAVGNAAAANAIPCDAAHYRRIGEDLIRAGKVGAFTVAGGQGTRLGWNGPKGTYPASVVAGKPLFRLFAEQLLATEKKYGVAIPWYIMTSPLNDDDTRSFLQDNNCFGLSRRNIFMFPQGMLPSFEMETGRLLLAKKHDIAMNPDGHGGSIKALRESGATEDMGLRGIEHICYFQVDNPLVRAIDPLFLGLHVAAEDSSAQMSSKMVAKAYPEEKVGVFCRADGKTQVIEYSDLPTELAAQTDDAGGLRFNAGSIAVHIISMDFVEQLTEDPDRFALPYHRAEKKVAHIDTATGERIEPREPNAVKLETFVFDALPLAESSIVLETKREDEFAPIKNGTGVDSAQSSHQLQSDRAARWLEQCGVRVPWKEDGHVDAMIEIAPLTALEPDDLKRAELPREIKPGESILL